MSYARVPFLDYPGGPDRVAEQFHEVLAAHLCHGRDPRHLPPNQADADKPCAACLEFAKPLTRPYGRALLIAALGFLPDRETMSLRDYEHVGRALEYLEHGTGALTV